MPAPIRSNILAMSPYSPGKPIDEVKRELGLTEVVKLASNENPLGPSPLAVAAVRAAAEQMHLYPDAASYDLRKKLSEHFGVDYNQVLVGNGSDEIIHLLGQIFLGGPDDEIVVGYPSFVRYDAAAHLADCQIKRVPLDSSLTHDLDAMAAAVGPKTRLVWIANPNNPTGTIVRKAEFEAFLDKMPSHVTVVLDEAYFEYAQGVSDFPNSVDYVKAGRSVIGLRTFSKAYGLAGIRVGYGFAAPDVVDAINRAREPFHVNSLAHAAACAALDDTDFIQRTVAANADGLRILEEAFRSVGAKPIESFANFVCADLGRPAKPVFEALLKRGVIVRSGHVLGLDNYLRVSIGTNLENEKFAQALVEAMKELVPA